jgi:hypothetical protein
VVQGDVSTLRGDPNDWVAATANAPVEQGDVIATGPHSRTELQLDYANLLRLDQGAEAKVAELDPTRIQVQIASGLVDFAIFKDTEADVEIDTPNMAIHPTGDGVYRVQVNSVQDTQLTVRRGHAEVTTPHGSMNVDQGQVIDVKGTDNPEYRLAQADGKDDWDRWNDDRDHSVTNAQAWQYTNHYYTGSEDLDRYGDWVQVPGYGWCWMPYVDAGWVPYRDGRWVSDAYFGWMWVGYEPWGWAPYHYGRWFFYGGNWCWWPGVAPDGPRPVWAPGYVAFFGFGGRPGGAGPDVGFDSIGWCPLGPRDLFNPWWGQRRDVIGIDVANLNDVPATESHGPGGPAYGSNLQGIMTHADLWGAITVVPSQDFANGRIKHSLQPVNESMLQQGSLMQGTLPVTPTKASLQLVNRPVNRAALPTNAADNQHFFTRTVGPGSRAYLPAGQMNPMANKPPAGANPPTRAGSMAPAPQNAQPRPLTPVPQGNAGGWRRFSLPAVPGAGQTAPLGTASPRSGAPPGAPPSQAAPDGNQSGWQRFKSPPARTNPGTGVTAPQGQGGSNRVEARPIGTNSLSTSGG